MREIREREVGHHIIIVRDVNGMRIYIRPYLAIEGDWRLIEPGLLRVPDVRRDDLVEGQAMGSVRLELYAVFLGFNGQLTAHGILDIEDRGIQRIDCESAHIVSVTAAAERAEEKNFGDATRH